MSNPMKFTKGVSNAKKDTTLSEYLSMDQTRVITFFEDFHTYAVTDWVATATSVGDGTSAAAMSDAYVGGAIVITNAANDNDSYWLQQAHDVGTGSADSEVWRIQTGKKAWFKAKFQVSDIDKLDLMLGIYKTATDPIDTAPTDGVWFESNDDVATIDFHCVLNSAYTSETAVGNFSITDATDVVVGFYWDGVTTFKLYINDVYVGSMTATAVPNDEYMAISFGCQNGEAVADTMTVDYIFAACER